MADKESAAKKEAIEEELEAKDDKELNTGSLVSLQKLSTEQINIIELLG